MESVPSSKNRRRVEIPVAHYDRLKQIADAEGRTVTSVLDELLGTGLRSYQPVWEPSGQSHRLSDSLTDRARHVLELARQDAPRRFNHNYSGTEHILLALVEEGEGVGGRVLRSFGLGPIKVGSAIEFIIGRGKDAVRTPTAYAPRVYKVLALALDEARQLGHDMVGTGHLLLGLIREGQGIAAGVLESQGINFQAIRDATLQMLARSDMPLSEEGLPAVAAEAGIDEASEKTVAEAEDVAMKYQAMVDRLKSSPQAAKTQHQDRTLTCAACGKEFLFTAGEQAFYADKGFVGHPGRCPECRSLLSLDNPPAPPRPSNTS